MDNVIPFPSNRISKPKATPVQVAKPSGPFAKARLSAVDQLIERWSKSSDPKFYGRSSAVSAHGDRLFSYNECIALKGAAGVAHVSDVRYSVTTSKHQNKARIALEMAGFKVRLSDTFLSKE